MNRLILTFFVFLLSLIANGQQRPDVLFFKDRLQPVSADNIFKTAGCYNWGPSIIKGKDGKYHLFYSRWSKEHEFTGWLTLNHVVLQEDIAFGERVSEFVRTQAYRCLSSRSSYGCAFKRVVIERQARPEIVESLPYTRPIIKRNGKGTTGKKIKYKRKDH